MKRMSWLIAVFLLIGVLGAYYGKPSPSFLVINENSR